MWEDPIVAEVHQTREKFAAECNFDVTTFFAAVRKRQAALGDRLVRQKTEPNQRLQQTGSAVSVPPGSIPLEATPAAEL
jgi:hypothetical protein